MLLAHDDELYLSEIDEPKTFAEAEEEGTWRRAMDEEMESIVANKTWRLVDLPAGHKPIGLKWVYCPSARRLVSSRSTRPGWCLTRKK